MYVGTRLGRWFYEERGRKRAEDDAVIVLWHSFLCDGGMWDGQVSELAEIGRVLVFDGPGHGKSEVPPPFALDDNVRALVDALETLAPGPIVMAGLSWGGMIAMRLSLLEPPRVRGLVVLDSNADAEERNKRIRYRAMLALFRTTGLPPWLEETEVAPLMFGHSTLAERPELAKRFFADLGGFPREGVARAGKAIFWREDIASKLGRIDAPTMVVCGREDAATPIERSRTIARGIPRSSLEIVERAGHLSAMEQPEAVNRIIVPFIREHLTRSG